NAEAGRLAGPGLCLSQHIAAGTQRGDRLLLDGGRRRIAHGGQRAGDRPIDRERAEEVERLGRNQGRSSTSQAETYLQGTKKPAAAGGKAACVSLIIPNCAA